MLVFSRGLSEVPESLPMNGQDWPASSDVLEMHTAGDSSAASGSSSSNKENKLGEPGSDSSPNLYMMESDGRRSESSSNITLVVNHAFDKLDKAYRVLRQAMWSHNQ